MLPVLQIGSFALQTYPLALLLGGWLALAVAGRAGKRLGIPEDHVYNAALYALIAGVVGARFAHVVAYWQAYRTQPLEIFGFNTQAFIAWPGLIAAVIVGGWYVYRHRLAPVRFLDALAPGLLVGLAIASLGALLAGRLPGAPVELPWSVDLWGVLRHPSQVYEAVAYLAVAALAWSAVRRESRPGVPALLALLGYGLARWLLEPFRVESTTILSGLRVAQVVGLALALLALFALRALAGANEGLKKGAPDEQAVRSASEDAH